MLVSDVLDPINDLARDMGVPLTFCYLIIFIIVITITYAIISGIIGGKRRRKERYEKSKKSCPACGGDNDPDALLCSYCEEML